MRDWKPRRYQFVLVGLLAGAVGACASGGGGQQTGASAVPGKVVAQVINTREYQMQIRVVTEFQNILLGSMSAYDTAVFEIPAALVGNGRNLELVADPVGGANPYFSSPVFVHLGDLIQWRIQGIAIRKRGAVAPRAPTPIGRGQSEGPRFTTMTVRLSAPPARLPVSIRALTASWGSG